MNISVVGLGYIGLPTAIILGLNEHNVRGFDIDIYIISVPTPFREGRADKVADLSYVENAAEMVAEKLKEGDLVILESTVPPGATRRMTDLLAEKSGLSRESFYTAHCPERVLPGNIMYEMEHNDRIIGAESQGIVRNFSEGRDDICHRRCDGGDVQVGGKFIQRCQYRFCQ